MICGLVFFLIALGPPHVRPMERTRGQAKRRQIDPHRGGINRLASRTQAVAAGSVLAWKVRSPQGAQTASREGVPRLARRSPDVHVRMGVHAGLLRSSSSLVLKLVVPSQPPHTRSDVGVGACTRIRAVKYSWWGVCLISPAHLHVRSMGRACG